MVASHSPVANSARSPLRSPVNRVAVGNASGSVWPRLNIVTSWPRDSASLTIWRPTRRVPPRMRIRMRGDVSLLAVTPFARAVLDAVDQIPAGRVMSYGDVAEMVGAGSGRAV